MSRQIKVSDSTHEKLHIVKKANRTGSLDGAIIHMMQGCIDEQNIIKREQVAFTLEYEGYRNTNSKNKSYEVMNHSEREVTFRQLRKAEVGDIIEPELGNEMYYSYEIATVVYTDEEFVALKITNYVELPWLWDYEDVRFLGVHLF